jgi:hypothetical protein
MSLEKQAHGGFLNRYEKGAAWKGNRNGRPRKYITELAPMGYKNAQVMDCIQVLMAMTTKELQEVLKNEDSTVLERTLANALLKSLSKGSLYSVDTLLSRVYGKPKETTAVIQDSKIEVVFVKGKTIL